MPQMMRLHPHAVKLVVTRRPDSVTAKVSSFSSAARPWMMSRAPIVSMTAAAKTTHPVHADVLYWSVDTACLLMLGRGLSARALTLGLAVDRSGSRRRTVPAQQSIPGVRANHPHGMN